MKRLVVSFLMVLLFAGGAIAATTITRTDGSYQIAGSNSKIHWIKWVMVTTTTDDQFDEVTLGGTALSNVSGTILGIMSVPDATNPPADLYDIYILDAAGADILDAQGEDFSATKTTADNRRFPVDSVNAIMPVTLCGDTIHIYVDNWRVDDTEQATFYLFYK